MTTSELNTRENFRRQGKHSRHVETYEQYCIRIEWLPGETNPIQYIPRDQPLTDLKTKGVFQLF